MPSPSSLPKLKPGDATVDAVDVNFVALTVLENVPVVPETGPENAPAGGILPSGIVDCAPTIDDTTYKTNIAASAQKSGRLEGDLNKEHHRS
jgi:hypothetical protein